MAVDKQSKKPVPVIVAEKRGVGRPKKVSLFVGSAATASPAAVLGAATAPIHSSAKPVVAKPMATKPLPVAKPAPAQKPALAKPAPVTAKPITSTPTPPILPKKEIPVNETITGMQNGATDAIKSGAQAAYTNGKAALEQVTTKSKETVEQGMKSLDELSATAKGNVEALMASTKAATAGLETIAHQVAEFSRKSFEETQNVARAMTTVKTPNEFMQLQSDFAKAQFDAAVAEMSKMSETLVKLAGEVFEPVQNRMALATDKIKTAASAAFTR